MKCAKDIHETILWPDLTPGCEIYEGGKKIQETEFKIEEKDGKTEIKFELEKDGKSDGSNIKSFAVQKINST